MFDGPLPECSIEPSSSTKRQTKESSATVKEQNPPRTLIASDVSQYYNKGRDYLEQRRNVLSGMTAPTPESSRVLRNENDVVFHGRLALVSILTPVFQQNDHFRGKVHVHGELAVFGLSPDLGIQYESKGKKKYIVMMEFKRTGFLQQSELNDFLYQEHEIRPGTLQPEERIWEKELGHNQEVSIVMQIKQIKAYATRSTCRYLAPSTLVQTSIVQDP